MVATLKPIQILGTALVELLSGRISDETIAAVDSITCIINFIIKERKWSRLPSL